MYEHLKNKLIEELTSNGIHDIFVIKAISSVPRELFVPDALMQRAYENVALPIGKEQTISQPYTVAFMMQELKLKKDFKILEIGTGSGYQAALLSFMGLQVYTIERDYDLFIRARTTLEKLNFRVACKYGDGTIGWPEFSPFDGIIVTAGAPSIPKDLLKQLKIGARLVIPVGDRITQEMQVITKENDTDFSSRTIPSFKFVPLIGRDGWGQ